MRIALVLEAPHQAGGVYQHFLSMLQSLQTLPGHEVVVLTPLRSNLQQLRAARVPCYLYRFGYLRRFLTRAVARAPLLGKLAKSLPRPLQKLCGPFDIELDAHEINLTFFFHSSLPLFVGRSAYVAIVYDLCHRDHPEFPEVSAEFESRERSFRTTLARAIAVIVSSRSLAHDVVRFYDVNETRLVVAPFAPALHSRGPASPAEVTRVRRKYGLGNDYVFYPAQFWPHKNHVYLLEALKVLEMTNGVTIDAALSGSDFGNQSHVRRVAEQLTLTGRVHLLGFVPDEDMAPLYTGARALVMPTYFGPTNMPPLEAIAVGCPVVYSDFPEFREQLGEAALYCDLRNPESLAEQLRSILSRSDVVAAMTEAGRELIRRISSDNHLDKIRTLLADFDYIRRRWS